MEIITSHIHLDLDGLAAMLVAKKIYPEAVPVFSGNLNENVRELVGLYQNYLQISNARDINEKEINKMIVVDTANKYRIGKFIEIFDKPNAEITIYDHHLGKDMHEDRKIEDEAVANVKLFMKNTGASTTFMLEKLLEIRPKLELEEYEATILMMGIYEDTGSLSHTTTTSEDIKMAAYLLEKGANLEIVNQYVSKSLKKSQVELMLGMIDKGELLEVKGETIFVTWFDADSFIDGIDILANKIKDIEGVDSIFIVIGNEKNCYIIGRSSSQGIHIGNIVGKFGGGGHKNAGSASVKSRKPKDIAVELKEMLDKTIISTKSAADIMSKPVKTIYPSMKIEDVYKIMLRFGYSGLPIVQNSKILGIISRKDIDKAMSHGYGNAPAKAYMTSKTIYADLSTGIEKLKKIMIENEIGRIPILNETGVLCGIVTRSDILRTLYDLKKEKTIIEKKFEENIRRNLENRIPENILKILEKTGELAFARKERAFLVGGIVRDILLDIPNLDIDIVVEGNGMEFAMELSEKLNAEKLVIHEKFKTGVIVLSDGLKIDIATSRVEYYEYPTSLPTVEAGSIKQDLFRRDFTINAMAIEIDGENFGKLIDFFDGYGDLKEKKIKILHNLSFIEDPTRIIRGIKFAARYNFEIEKDTAKFINDAVDKGLLGKLTWKRVKKEIIGILSESNVEIAVDKFFDFKVSQAIHPSIQYTEQMKNCIKQVKKYYNIIKKLDIEKWIIYFLILLEDLNDNELEEVFEKFVFTNKFRDKYKYGKSKRENISKELKSVKKKSELFTLLSNLSNEVILLILITQEDSKIEENILKYIEIADTKPLVTGEDLIALGYKPSREFSEILKRLFEIQLDEGIVVKEKLLGRLS